MSVVGFDIGYQACHIAIARHGGVEMVANEYSDRRSPTMVAFGPKQRCMGVSARNQQVMNFKNTVWGFKTLLGRKFSDPYVQDEIKHLPFKVVEHGKDHIGITVQHGDGEQTFSPEQVTAMMLGYLKQVAEKALGKPVADCVISIPSHFTDAQRRAMLDASAIAGLNCLRLLNETTAAALAYGIYKQDLPAETEKPRNVAFVDMGHSSLEVSICAFQKGKLKVLSKAYDHSLGGRDFDRRLMEYFSAEFKSRTKIDSLTLPRQTLRLTYECERLKKSMGTVTQPVKLSLECFANDKDLSGSTKRDKFIEMCADLLERIRIPLEDALAKSKLSLGDIEAVELVGGSCRVPAIKDIIMDVFKRELSTTLNLDEAVSRGCALQCAMLSPTFKVRDFNITDIQPYPIKLRWQTAMEGEEGEMVVFKEGDSIYHSKILSFYRKEPFELEASYESPEQVPSSNSKIGVFVVKNVAPTAEGEASKVKLKVRLNIHGVFMVKSATMVEKVKEEVEAMETDSTPQEAQEKQPTEATDQAPPTTDASQTPPGETQNGDEAQQQQTNDAEMADSSTTTSTDESQANESKPSDSPPTEKSSNGAAKPPESKKPKKPTVKYVDLPIHSRTTALSKQELTKANEVEVNLRYQDQLEIEKVDARNSLEEYMYNMRDKLGYDLKDYITEDDRAQFMTILNSTEEWIYDEGEDQLKKVYVERLAELKKMGDPVQQREIEFQERPKAFNEMGTLVIHFEKILAQYDAGEEVYNHIEKEEMDKVRNFVLAKREWMTKQMQACQNLPKSSNPPVTSAEIRNEMMKMETDCNPIVTKPKPKVEPPKDEAKPETTAEGEASTTEGETATTEGEGATTEGEGATTETSKETKMEAEESKPNAEGEEAGKEKEEEMDVDLD